MTITNKQREARKNGIGASDAPIILGLSPWKTPLTLYMEKRGEIEPEDQTDAQRWGNLLEPAIIAEAERKLSTRFKRGLDTLYHPKLPFVFAHLDGINPSEHAIIEAKRSGDGRDYGAEDSDEVPEYVKAQVQKQMGLVHLAHDWRPRLAFVPVLIGRHEHRIMRVPYDERTARNIIECSRAFWVDHVKTGRPPAPITGADVSRRWPIAKGALKVSPAVALQVAKLKSLRDKRNKAADAFVDASNELRLIFGRAESLAYQGREIATFATQQAPVFDIDRFFEWLERKDRRLYRAALKFRKTQPMRVLRLK